MDLKNIVKPGANKRRLLISILVIVGLIILTTAYVIWVWIGDELSPAEQTALEFTKAAYMRCDLQKLKNYLDPEHLQVSQYQDLCDGWVSPGKVLIGQRQQAYDTKVVIFFDEPKMTKNNNRLEITLVQKQGRWLVIQDEFKGKKSQDFDQFKESDDFKELGIEEWKSAELSN